jgi:hypothetical protein
MAAPMTKPNDDMSANVHRPSDSEILQRLLAALEANQKRSRLELAMAIVLSLATLASTWCGYQATLWTGAAGDAQSAAETYERDASTATIEGLQMRTFDAVEILAFWDALRANNDRDRDAIFSRMRPELKRALQASLDAGVLTDPTVAGPFRRAEYDLEVERKATENRTKAAEKREETRVAGQRASAYILMTLLCASVLFFGGITGTISTRRIRLTLGVAAIVLFAVTLVVLATLPVATG